MELPGELFERKQTQEAICLLPFCPFPFPSLLALNVNVEEKQLFCELRRQARDSPMSRMAEWKDRRSWGPCKYCGSAILVLDLLYLNFLLREKKKKNQALFGQAKASSTFLLYQPKPFLATLGPISKIQMTDPEDLKFSSTGGMKM